MQDHKKIGEKLRLLLKQKKISGREAGKLLGLSEVHISRILNGKSALTMRHAVEIAKVLEVPVDEIVGQETAREEISGSDDPELLQLVRQAARKRPDQVPWLKGFLRGMLLSALISVAAATAPRRGIASCEPSTGPAGLHNTYSRQKRRKEEEAESTETVQLKNELEYELAS